MSTRIIGKKDALVSMRIKFITINIVVMNKRSTTKDSGRNREGIIFLDHGASFRVVELVWEDLVRGVELGSLLLDVDHMAGEKQSHF
jgi:hypothetical protein